MYCLSLRNIVLAILVLIVLKQLMKYLGCNKEVESFSHEEVVGAELEDVYETKTVEPVVKFDTAEPLPAFDYSLNLVPKGTTQPEIIQSTIMPMTPDATPDAPEPVESPSKDMGVMPLQGELGVIAATPPPSMDLSPTTPAPVVM